MRKAVFVNSHGGGLPIPSTSPSKRHLNFSPVSWSEYFDSNEPVVTDRGIFGVYRKNMDAAGPVVLCLHGAGYSGTSWAPLTEEMTKSCSVSVLAPDLRYHGESENVAADSDSKDFSFEAMSADVVSILQQVLEDRPRPVVVVGHSMGGALAAYITGKKLIPTAVGVIVIDVVEGTAMDALSHMKTILAQRPTSFTSLEHGIEWCVRSGQTHSRSSACISMPSQLKLDGDTYRWRVNLEETQPFWPKWFTGLTDNFLGSPTARLLILAGVDRLDKALMVAQMQGKFQLQLFPQCGHSVHEDAPERVSQSITQFIIRNRWATAIVAPAQAPPPPFYPGFADLDQE